MKKILALVLSIMMLATFVPIMAFAETAEDTTDILTSRGLDYTVYEADPGDLTPATLTEEALLAMTKEVGISGTKRNYVDASPYIRVDLGKKCEITSILSFSGGSVHRGVVTAKYSVDGLTWYNLSTSRVQYNKTAGANTYNSGATYANNFIATEPVVAKYLEITLIGNTSDKSVQHNMINIYGRPLSATKLSSLTVENATLGAEFDADVAEYTAEISTYENMPVVSATAETEGASVTITQATAETMKATVEVSYEGEATRTYTINFTVPQLPAPNGLSYYNGVLAWVLTSHSNLTNTSGEYSWTEADGTTVDVPCIQVDVYDENDVLVESIDVNHLESGTRNKLTLAFYLKAYIEEAGTYKVSAALKKEDGTLGEKAWLEGVVIDALDVVSLPEKGATAIGKGSHEAEEKDVTENLLSSDVRRGNYYGKNLEGYVTITLAAPAKISSIMAHQCGYRVRGTYSYSLDGINWTPLVAGTDISVPGNDNNFKSTYSSSGYTFIPVKEGKEFVAQYIKYEHPALSGNYAVNQIYVNGEFVDVNYSDIALTQADGKVTASVSGQYVMDSTPTNGNAVLFTATYKMVDGMKVLVSISDYTAIKGYSLTEAVTRSVEVNAPTEAGTYVVKAFLLRDMNTIVPIVASPEITITVQ